MMKERKSDIPLNVEIISQSVVQWREDLHDFGCSLFMTPEWVEAVCSENNSPVFLSFIQGETVVGKLAGLQLKLGSLKGDQLFFYAGPALKEADQDLLNACCRALLVFARQNSIQSVVMGSYDQPLGLVGRIPGFYINERYEYIVDLQPDAGDISFSQNLKRNVKKAKKLNAALVKGDDPELLNRLVELLNNTLEQRVSKYGNEYDPFYLPYLNEASLKRLVDLEAGSFYLVKMEEDDVAHCVLFNLETADRVFNLLVGSDDLAYQKGLAALADFELIHKYREEGVRYYNLGGGTGDAGSAGLERSKQSKGAEKKMVYGATTNYLCYPHRMINPLLNLGRFLLKQKRLGELINRVKK